MMAQPPVHLGPWLDILHRSVVEWGLEDPARYEAITGTRVAGLGKGEHFRPNAIITVVLSVSPMEAQHVTKAGYEDDE